MSSPVVWAFGPDRPRAFLGTTARTGRIFTSSLRALAGLLMIVRSIFSLLNIENSVHQ